MLNPLQFVRLFWGVAVLLGLCGYSMVAALDARETEPDRSSSRPLALVPTTEPTPHPTPIGGYPTPAPLTIFLACDCRDSNVAAYVFAPGGYVVLRVDNDRQLIVDLINGRSTRFGTVLSMVQTPCVRELLRTGQLP